MARPRQITNEQILCAMREAVLAHGPAVSLDFVASSLGVTGPALLKRFGSRKALLLEALRPPEKPAWLELLARGPSEERLEPQLLTIFTAISEYMAQVVPCISALRESSANPEEVFGDDRSPMRGVKALHRWLLSARKKGLVCASELETAAFSMLGAIQMRAFLAHVAKQEFSPASQKRYLSELAALFTRALTTAL